MWSTALKIVLAWVPFYALWTLFVLAYAGATLGAALRGSAITIGLAAALGMAVWSATGRFPWPDRIRVGFYLLHAGLATLYSVVWFAAGQVVGGVLTREPIDLRFWVWADSGWRFLMGVWLYGLVAGICYAVRIRRRLREQERAAARLEALATKARLESLQARLNPHFLFNALNSVAALIHDDPNSAEDAVERLADLLRYSLAESDGPVTLGEEWTFTRAYLDMEALRLGDRLSVDAAFDEKALGVHVPSFALQTLVENAVRHGVSPREDGGTITIDASVDDSRLMLSVRDDGAGMDTGTSTSSGGTGLKNLRERLSGSYGPDATLDVDFPDQGGCVARLEIPLRAGNA